MPQAKFLYALLLSLLALTTAAQDMPPAAAGEAEAVPERWAVEIILFRYGAGVPTGNELFVPEEPPAPDWQLEPRVGDVPGSAYGDPGLPDSNALDAAAPGFDEQPAAEEPAGDEPLELGEIVLPANLVRLEVLPREQLTLRDTWERLERLDAYEPLLWAGWAQDAVERERSPEIALRRLGSAPAEFDGTLTLYLSRFLHLVVDLAMTPRDSQPGARPAAPVFGDARRVEEFAAGPAVGRVRMRIDEDRIVRNGELRYFDHPRFGLLAKVTRVETPVDDDPADDDAGLPAGRVASLAPTPCCPVSCVAREGTFGG